MVDIEDGKLSKYVKKVKNMLTGPFLKLRYLFGELRNSFEFWQFFSISCVLTRHHWFCATKSGSCIFRGDNSFDQGDQNIKDQSI